VRNVQSVSVAACLAAVVVLSSISDSFAASSSHRAQASSRLAEASAPVSRAAETPPNCIRESCGRLWCWQMRGSGSHK
jgi:hypothetical protein